MNIEQNISTMTKATTVSDISQGQGGTTYACIITVGDISTHWVGVIKNHLNTEEAEALAAIIGIEIVASLYSNITAINCYIDNHNVLHCIGTKSKSYGRAFLALRRRVLGDYGISLHVRNISDGNRFVQEQHKECHRLSNERRRKQIPKQGRKASKVIRIRDVPLRALVFRGEAKDWSIHKKTIPLIKALK